MHLKVLGESRVHLTGNMKKDSLEYFLQNMGSFD